MCGQSLETVVDVLKKLRDSGGCVDNAKRLWWVGGLSLETVVDVWINLRDSGRCVDKA